MQQSPVPILCLSACFPGWHQPLQCHPLAGPAEVTLLPQLQHTASPDPSHGQSEATAMLGMGQSARNAPHCLLLHLLQKQHKPENQL